jgi:hypothetical protein
MAPHPVDGSPSRHQSGITTQGTKVRSRGQLLHCERTDVQLHRDDLAVTNRPDVRHLHHCRRARRAVLPRVGAGRDHGVVFGNESCRGNCEIVADLCDD